RAGLAGFQPRDRERSRDAEGRVAERNLHAVNHVASRRTRRASAAKPGEPEEVLEEIGELAEDGRIEALAEAGTSSHSRVAEAIVQGPLLRVGEDRVGFRGLLELLGGAVV